MSKLVQYYIHFQLNVRNEILSVKSKLFHIRFNIVVCTAFIMQQPQDKENKQ
jgi:hypothetical protein